MRTHIHTHPSTHTGSQVHAHTQAYTLAHFLSFSPLLCWGWAHTEAALTLTCPHSPPKSSTPCQAPSSQELTSKGWGKEEASWTLSLPERREVLRGPGGSSLPAESCLAPLTLALATLVMAFQEQARGLQPSSSLSSHLSGSLFPSL